MSGLICCHSWASSSGAIHLAHFWMGLATLLMVLEKLPQVAHYVIKPVGVLLVGAGVVLLVFAAVGI